MSFNGSGTFQINTAGQPVVSGTVISSTAFNALTADLATGLSTCITKDGQTTVTANLPMSTFKFTGLGAGSAATDSANLSQVQSTVVKLLGSVSGADTITAVGSPVVTAYAAGQMFYFVAAGANTTTVTLNIDGLGAKAVTRDGATALAAGDIQSGEVCVVVYDGTRFQLINAANSFGNTTINGTLTVTGNTNLQANVSITSALNVGGVATFTSNPVLSAGTANGVLYLNASKAATSGSALTFSGTNLGIGTASAATPLEITSTTLNAIRMTLGSEARTHNISAVNNGRDLAILPFRNATLQAGNGTAEGLIAINAYEYTIFGTGSSYTERMRLTDTGLGIGTSSPTGKLSVSLASATGTGGASSFPAWDSTYAVFGNTASTSAAVGIGFNTTNGGVLTAIAPNVAWQDMNYLALSHRFYTSATETMRLTSTGLGIGTSSPDLKLTVNGAMNLRNSSRAGAFEIDSSGNLWMGTATTAGNIIFETGHSSTGLPSTGTERMRLDGSGNLGLGVTPSAWSTLTALQMPVGGLAGYSGAATNKQFHFLNNAYYGASGWTYRESDYAQRLTTVNGQYQFYIAPQGTAGNAITFTQAMTLDASGRLIVGGSSAVVGFPVEIVSNSSGQTLSLRGRSSDASAALTFNANAAATEYARIFSDNNSILAFGTGSSGTERARITSGGEWVVGKTATGLAAAGFEVGTGSAGYVQTVLASSANTVTTWDTYSTGAGAYRFYVGMAGTVFATNTTISAISDQRLKENVRDLDAGLAEVLALKPRKFDWKEGKGQDKKDVRGFIAQEFEQVFPDLIDTWKDPAPEGEEPYKSVRQDLIPVLVKAIQEQQAMINELKAEVAALKGA